MSTNQLQYETPITPIEHKGIVWNQLHSEREDVCEALLQAAQSTPLGPASAASTLSTQFVDKMQLAHRLQRRLALIDSALDRLMAGNYGDCVVCGRWIEDPKLHSDPAFPFCLDCERESNRHRSV